MSSGELPLRCAGALTSIILPIVTFLIPGTRWSSPLETAAQASLRGLLFSQSWATWPGGRASPSARWQIQVPLQSLSDSVAVFLFFIRLISYFIIFCLQVQGWPLSLTQRPLLCCQARCSGPFCSFSCSSCSVSIPW